MRDTVFREYDIRGIVGTELSVNHIYDLGRAIISYCFDKKNTIKTIVIGRDGRTSSPYIANELMRAAQDAHCTIVDLGVVPSPVLYFALHRSQGDVGLMVTASHNPSEYNGIKIMLGTECVWGEEIKTIKTYFKRKIAHVVAQAPSVVTTNNMIIDQYINYLVSHFPLLKNSTISMVFDCAHAVAGVVLPKLATAFGWHHVEILYSHLDGSFPSHEADPTVKRNMSDLIEQVKQKNAAIGIGFDGDADRMAAVTEKGNLLLGDRLLALFAEFLDDDKKKGGVVFNVTMSSALVTVLQRHNMLPIMVPTGHAIVKEYMKKHNAFLGGEGSCHFFFADRYFGYDDGIYAALRLVEIMIKKGQSLEMLTASFPLVCSSPEYRIGVAENEKKKIIEKVKHYFSTYSLQDKIELITIDGVRVEFPFGWGIVRAANTQPVISLRFESKNEDTLIKIKKIFYTILKPYLNEQIEVILEN